MIRRVVAVGLIAALPLLAGGPASWSRAAGPAEASGKGDKDAKTRQVTVDVPGMT